ncbi:MAG: DUF4366 domain-containing protein [Pseudobutyrivibrio sp.]|nr:DUF4366 domain-containing protein [Pseudobutyrivibrio sp.]
MMKRINLRGKLMAGTAVISAFLMATTPMTAFAMVSEEESKGPLTPEGNLSLVDDYAEVSSDSKQFITVVTKSGNYFYLVIDRDDNGTDTVHFLNMVDESDLLSLMDEDAVKAYAKEKEAKDAAVEEPIPTEPTESEPVEIKEDTNLTGIMAIVLVAALAGIGGYFYFSGKKKETKKTVGPDPDEEFLEDEEDYLSEIPQEEDELC